VAELLDDDGYPTEAALKRVEEWEIKEFGDCAKLLGFVQELWKHDDYFHETDGVYSISTAGWSGNEDLMCSMHRNMMFQVLCWCASRRGGHYIYCLPGVKVTVKFDVEKD
jgi:hypothetical protein